MNNPEKYIAKRLDESELFTRKFGTFTKADYETLMFSIYLGLHDEPQREYDISIALGIPESKVRSLRVKAQLLYPVDIDIKAELYKALQNAQYDPKMQTITMTIEDPSVQNMIKNQIEIAYGTVHLTLNPKHLALPIEGFILLLSIIDMDQKDAINRLNKEWRKSKKAAEDITKEKLIKRLWDKKSDAETIFALVSAGIAAWPHLSNVLQQIECLLR